MKAVLLKIATFHGIITILYEISRSWNQLDSSDFLSGVLVYSNMNYLSSATPTVKEHLCET